MEKLTHDQMTCLMVGALYQLLAKGPVPLSQLDDEAEVLAAQYGFSRKDAMKMLHAVFAQQEEYVKLDDGTVALTAEGKAVYEQISAAINKENE